MANTISSKKTLNNIAQQQFRKKRMQNTRITLQKRQNFAKNRVAQLIFQ
jgi:hypothetical protein